MYLMKSKRRAGGTLISFSLTRNCLFLFHNLLSSKFRRRKRNTQASYIFPGNSHYSCPLQQTLMTVIIKPVNYIY